MRDSFGKGIESNQDLGFGIQGRVSEKEFLSSRSACVNIRTGGAEIELKANRPESGIFPDGNRQPTRSLP